MTLSAQQISDFRRDGYLVVENAVTPKQLAALRADFAAWVEESKAQSAPYGTTLDGRPRFDLEPGHSAAKPALRRVNAPIEVSQAHFDVMRASTMTQAVVDLIGPNVKLHHTKTNSKLPGAATSVKWHQDFPFTPHSNDDLVTALLFVDEVTADNGPLEVLVGSHTGAIHGLWHGGVFTGAIDEAEAQRCQARAISCTGPAGAVCLMHTRLLHGSAPNLSDRPRTLFICVYSADDALPLSPSPMPNDYEGLLVAGIKTGRVRSVDFQIQLPQLPKTASFFDQQAEA